MVPRMQALTRVRTFDPTEVPKELATSLAPIPKARRKETMKPRITIQSQSSGIDTDILKMMARNIQVNKEVVVESDNLQINTTALGIAMILYKTIR